MFTNLCYLNFQPSSIYWQHISCAILPRERISSSNLLELNGNLKIFNHCLYLLDARFNELHTLYVKISSIRSDQTIENQVN